jgi:hypothetical protein
MIGLWPQRFAPLGMFVISWLQTVVTFHAQFVGMFVAPLHSYGLAARDRFPALSLLHRVQIGSRVHLVAYSMGTGGPG